jgi:hypothetical protein
VTLAKIKSHFSLPKKSFQLTGFAKNSYQQSAVSFQPKDKVGVEYLLYYQLNISP